jgi:hypothetical protein
MKKITATLLAVFCFWLPVFSKAVLSQKSKVSLITCGPGEALYEAFGHSAIRVYDPAQGLDVIFNYGVFDFNQSNFYLNFAKGNMLYCLGISQTADFIYTYRYYGRSVREQVLNLDSAERQAVLNYLDKNLLPENKNYLYNYFRNNCSTKIPEMLDAALEKRVIWQPSDISGKASYRSLIYQYTSFHPWGRLGIDLGLGSVIDSRIDGKQLNFLPVELEKSFNRARIRRDMTEFPLVLESNTLFEAPVFFGSSPFFSSPDTVFFLVLMASVLLWFFSGHFPPAFRIFRSILLITCGILGLVQSSIWFFTNHMDAAWNLNLLWTCPLLLIPGTISLFRKDRFQQVFQWLSYYFILLPGIWFFLPQTLNASLIPLVMAMGISCMPQRPEVSSKNKLIKSGNESV